MGFASCMEDIEERTAELEYMRRFDGLTDKYASDRVLYGKYPSINQNASGDRGPQRNAERKQNRLCFNPLYAKLIEKEKALSGSNISIHDVVYWPIRLVKSKTNDPIATRILQLVWAGYSDVATLSNRIAHYGNASQHIESLMLDGWLQLRDDGKDSLTVVPVKHGPVMIDSLTTHEYFDEITLAPLSLPSGASLVSSQELEETAPVLGIGIASHDSSITLYLECLVMLIASNTHDGSVRLYHRLDNIPTLERILYEIAAGSGIHVFGRKSII